MLDAVHAGIQAAPDRLSPAHVNANFDTCVVCLVRRGPQFVQRELGHRLLLLTGQRLFVGGHQLDEFHAILQLLPGRRANAVDAIHLDADLVGVAAGDR